ncbi:MAG TPA: FMN-binding protein [Xanthobacteraceae bacterium]|nr:FMN-binding protein [Xanthobacteraceae bacterium]
MSDWARLTLPAVVAATIVSPAHAVQYLTIDAAQKLAFPAATRFVENGGLTWKAQAGDKLLGLFVVDHVIGKHLYIDYAVALDTTGRVTRIDILQYRESYGGEVREPNWLAQFVGKTKSSSLKVGSDIRNISGATLSSAHLTEGVKRILATYGSRAR